MEVAAYHHFKIAAIAPADEEKEEEEEEFYPAQYVTAVRFRITVKRMLTDFVQGCYALGVQPSVPHRVRSGYF